MIDPSTTTAAMRQTCASMGVECVGSTKASDNGSPGVS